MAKYEGLPDKNIIRSFWNKIKNWVEQQGYKTTDTNTTYTLEQNSSDGHIISLKSSEGENQTITIPSGASTKDIINLIYPVGSIYLSTSAVSPGTLFGGTWQRLENRMLVGAGSSYSVGSTGGSADAVVVSHYHSIPALSGTATGGNHTHIASRNLWAQLENYGQVTPAASGGANMANIVGRENFLGYSGSLTMSVTTNGSTTYWQGESGSGKNMPPYLAVYMWKRIA